MKEIIFSICGDNLLPFSNSNVGDEEIILFSAREGAKGAFLTCFLMSKEEEILSRTHHVEARTKRGGDLQEFSIETVLLTCNYKIKAVFGESLIFCATKTFQRKAVGHLGEIKHSGNDLKLGSKAIVKINYEENISGTYELFGRKSPRFFFCNPSEKSDTVEVKSHESFADCLLMPEGSGSVISVYSGVNQTTIKSVSDARMEGYITF